MTDTPTTTRTRSWIFYAALLILFWGVWGAFSALPATKYEYPDEMIYSIWALTMLIPAAFILRGKKWDYKLVLPGGETRAILSVPRYDFNWQTYYMFAQPLDVPKGAKIVSTAWYDNSPANKANPDPSKEVLWGDQTWEEMQYSGVLLSPN